MVTQGRKEESLAFCDSSDSFYHRMAQLNKLRKNRTFCDVVLQVGSSEVHAHRSVLACASPYFFELFTADDENRTASEDKLIYKLNSGFDRESIDLLVSYAYTGKFEAPSSIVKAVFMSANKLKMYNVAMACGEHLVSTLSPETCLPIRALPGIAASSLLVSRVDAYIQDQTDLLTVTRDPFGVPKLLLRVILSCWEDDTAITPRALVSLCLDWIRKQIMEEDTNLEELQEKMHLLYLNLDNSLHDCADIQTGSDNDSDIVQDYKKISRKHSRGTMKTRRKNSTMSQPAKPRMMLFSRSINNDSDEDYVDGEWKIIAYSKASENTYIGIVSLNGLVTIFSIQPHLQKAIQLPCSIASRPPSIEKVNLYTLIPHMSTPRCGSGVGTFQDCLLVCGGYDRGECLNDVQLYNPSANEWTDLSTMYQSRGRFDLTVLDGRAYAIAGCNGTKELNSVEVLDENLQWSDVAPLPMARSNAGVTSLDGKVYCIGGWNGQYGIKRCDVYDPQTDSWSTIASLHTGRYQAAVAACGGCIYAVGGCDSWNALNSVEVYNPETDTWRHVANMNTARRGCGLAMHDGKLYLVGGSDGTQSLCSVEVYNPQTNTWSVGPSMTSCRANVGVSVVGDRIYAVGGFSGKTFLNNIEFLDPLTQEWTNFTPKPEYLLRKSESIEDRESNSISASNTSLSFNEDLIHERIEEEEDGIEGMNGHAHGLGSKLAQNGDLIHERIEEEQDSIEGMNGHGHGLGSKSAPISINGDEGVIHERIEEEEENGEMNGHAHGSGTKSAPISINGDSSRELEDEFGDVCY